MEDSNNGDMIMLCGTHFQRLHSDSYDEPPRYAQSLWKELTDNQKWLLYLINLHTMKAVDRVGFNRWLHKPALLARGGVRLPSTV